MASSAGRVHRSFPQPPRLPRAKIAPAPTNQIILFQKFDKPFISLTAFFNIRIFTPFYCKRNSDAKSIALIERVGLKIESCLHTSLIVKVLPDIIDGRGCHYLWRSSVRTWYFEEYHVSIHASRMGFSHDRFSKSLTVCISEYIDIRIELCGKDYYAFLYSFLIDLYAEKTL
jgi:hypothetical protein